MTVRHDPANPERIQVVGMRRRSAAFLLAMLVAVPTALALVLFLIR